MRETGDDIGKHEQSQVVALMDEGKDTGKIVALPNNRGRVTHPGWLETGEGAPDFTPSQKVFHSELETEYVWDTKRVFDNLYSEEK